MKRRNFISRLLGIGAAVPLAAKGIKLDAPKTGEKEEIAVHSAEWTLQKCIVDDRFTAMEMSVVKWSVSHDPEKL